MDELRNPRKIKIGGYVGKDGETLEVFLGEATTKDLIALPGKVARGFAVKFEYSLLTFSGDLTFPGAAKMPLTHFPIPEIGPPHISYFTEIQAWEHWNDNLPNELSLTVQTFLLSVSIAFSGALSFGDVHWFVNRVPSSHRISMINPISEAVDLLVENNLSPSISLPLGAVHTWVCSKNGIFDGYSDSPSSRALNLLTRLFTKDHREDEITNLLWALAGIEALLVQSGRSSNGQLREKLTAVFKGRVDRKWLSSAIDRTYDFRSRMVHGNRPLRSHFRRSEEDTDKRFDEEYDSERFAVGVLLLLIQNLIETGKDGFEFETRLI